MTTTSVLVLDKTYSPLGVVSAKRALTLLYMGRAEMVHESDTEWHTPSRAVTLPTVIRLLAKQIHVKRRPLAWSKRGVMMRDGFTCQFSHCDSKATTIDHIHPTSRGGDPRAWENTIASCLPCNRRKADRSLEDMGWKLKRRPKPPNTLLVNVPSPPSDWAIYLPDLALRLADI